MTVNRHPEQTRRRLAQTASRLRSLVYPAARAPDRLLVSERMGRIGWTAAQELDYRPAEMGEGFGPQWATYWFRVEATIPDEWAGARVDLIWDSGSEATLWREGEPIQGLNSGGGALRCEAPLTTAARGGERVSVAVEMACNDWMGDVRLLGRNWLEPTDDRSARAPEVHARLARCAIARFDADAWALAWDFEALRELEAEHALDPAWAGHLLGELDRFCDEGDPAILAELLAHRNAGRTHRMVAIGHAHIDSAWLWPLAETRRKIVRSFANQLALMDRYP